MVQQKVLSVRCTPNNRPNLLTCTCVCVLITYVTDGSSAEVQFCEHAELIQHTIDDELTRHSGNTLREELINDIQWTCNFQITVTL